MAADEILDAEMTATSEPAKKPAKAKAPVDPDALSGKKVRLTIHKDGSPQAVKDVFVGINGVGYLIKRGEEVVVPVEVVNILENAIETRYEQDGDQLIARDVLSYPFNAVPV